MALYTPDYEYERAVDVLKSLPEDQRKSIEYLLKVKDDYLKSRQDLIEEYAQVFAQLKRFL